jgi:hypothetical protein
MLLSLPVGGKTVVGNVVGRTGELLTAFSEILLILVSIYNLVNAVSI